MGKIIKNKVEYLPIDEVFEYANNPRTIKKADFERLKKSIKENPDYFEARPLIISNRTGKNIIIAGNQRARAAVSLGLKEVPAVILKDLTEEREQEIMIRDNINNGDWDFDILANEFNEDLLKDWGVSISASDIKDLSEKLEFNEYTIEVKCNNEVEQEKLYNELTERGFLCKTS